GLHAFRRERRHRQGVGGFRRPTRRPSRRAKRGTSRMTKLPPGWTLASLEELAAPSPRSITDGPFGSNLKTEHYTDTGPRVVRLQNIGDGKFQNQQHQI